MLSLPGGCLGAADLGPPAQQERQNRVRHITRILPSDVQKLPSSCRVSNTDTVPYLLPSCAWLSSTCVPMCFVVTMQL